METKRQFAIEYLSKDSTILDIVKRYGFKKLRSLECIQKDRELMMAVVEIDEFAL